MFGRQSFKDRVFEQCMATYGVSFHETVPFKEQWHEMFCLRFFMESSPPMALIQMLKHFYFFQLSWSDSQVLTFITQIILHYVMLYFLSDENFMIVQGTYVSCDTAFFLNGMPELLYHSTSNENRHIYVNTPYSFFMWFSHFEALFLDVSTVCHDPQTGV